MSKHTEMIDKLLRYAEAQQPITDDGTAMLELAGEIRRLREAMANLVNAAGEFRAAASWDEQAVSCERYSDAYNALNVAIDAANPLTR